MDKEQQHFLYGQTEISALCQNDKAFSEAVARIGEICRAVTPELFTALVNSIVGQQISSKAQQTIWRRITDELVDITPQKIHAMPVEQIQQFGISKRKAGYIRDLAQKVCSGEFDINKLYELPDEQVIAKLCELSGIGVWTAEMLLLFSMQRPDVLSYGDLAIQRGLRMLYRHRTITRKLFEKYKRRYSPYGSVASLYLWEIASGRWGYHDPAPNKDKTKI
jgi:DNA-3-methyladenine glycosylase II